MGLFQNEVSNPLLVQREALVRSKNSALERLGHPAEIVFLLLGSCHYRISTILFDSINTPARRT